VSIYQLNDSIPVLKGLTPLKRAALNETALHYIIDILCYYPYKYVDRSSVLTTQALIEGSYIGTLHGYIKSISETGFGPKKRLEAIFGDQYGEIKLTWFRYYPNLKKNLETNKEFYVYGEFKPFNRTYSIIHPELISPENYNKNKSSLNGLKAEYPTNKALSKARIQSNHISKWISNLLEITNIEDPIPTNLKDQLSSRWSFKEALKAIHLPETENQFLKAKQYLSFIELLEFQLMLKLTRQNPEQIFKNEYQKPLVNTNQFLADLPFPLTEDQKKVIQTIRVDIKSGKQMQRLVQGDVGAGKTVVAFVAMLMAIDEGFSACMMAPTELLAEQHLASFLKFTSAIPIRIAFLSGSSTNKERTKILTDLANGQIDALFGTHAIFQDDVTINNIDMVVIDEQHRFGVEQRKALVNKGRTPHVLLMSATPIPRSLSLAVYGDLSISQIREKPKGRIPIKTAIRTDDKRDKLHHFLAEEIAKGGQVYVVYPLVEESEKMDLNHATGGYEDLKAIFKQYSVGLVHGKMKAAEKEYEMQLFKEGKHQILVSTTVIEVGVDVPAATVMIIEDAERFGLSQLHQLRGRVGRGDRQSYCVLMVNRFIGKTAKERLMTMVESEDGFYIAEKDLELRGPGDLLGTKQSGIPSFKLANIVEDVDLLEQAKYLSDQILKEDPTLTTKENEGLKNYLTLRYRNAKELFRIG
jgi:ATP-dependent DNA helicase RecG